MRRTIEFRYANVTHVDCSSQYREKESCHDIKEREVLAMTMMGRVWRNKAPSLRQVANRHWQQINMFVSLSKHHQGQEWARKARKEKTQLLTSRYPHLPG